VAFARIRVDMKTNNLSFTPGTYRFIHPYGEETFVVPPPPALPIDRIFITDDMGIACAPGDFSCALNRAWALPAAHDHVRSAVEMPPLTEANQTPDTNPAHFGGFSLRRRIPATGKAYIADPARLGPVTQQGEGS